MSSSSNFKKGKFPKLFPWVECPGVLALKIMLKAWAIKLKIHHMRDNKGCDWVQFCRTWRGTAPWAQRTYIRKTQATHAKHHQHRSRVDSGKMSARWKWLNKQQFQSFFLPQVHPTLCFERIFNHSESSYNAEKEKKFPEQTRNTHVVYFREKDSWL